jgi:hypothetical protein
MVDSPDSDRRRLRLGPWSETNRGDLGYFSIAGRHRRHGLHSLTGAGASTIGGLAVEVSQAELEEVFERKGAGEPDSHPPGVSGDHRANLKQLEADSANLSTNQFRGFEAQPAQRLQ